MNELKKIPAAGPATVFLRDASYNNIDAALVGLLTDLEGNWLTRVSGKNVFVKPNMLGLFPPEQCATTNPALVRGLVRLLRDAGAKVTVGDNCGIGNYGLNQRVAKVSGILEAAEGAYVNVAKDTVMAPLNSRFLDSIPVSRAMLEADVLISLPKMKTHSLTVVTGAVKNSFGLVAGAGKGLAHASAPGNKDFGEILAAIFAIRPPDLCIMDAVTAMEGNGPSGGKPLEVGKLMASTNAVALDAVMCRIMGFPPAEVHHLRSAARRGLGPLDSAAIKLVGELPPVKGVKLPVTIHKLSCVGRFINQRFYRPLIKSKLSLIESRCKQCRICVEACPTGAMQMEKGELPRIQEDVCIRCFCCHELCPESAWEMRGILGRLMMKGRE